MEYSRCEFFEDCLDALDSCRIGHIQKAHFCCLWVGIKLGEGIFMPQYSNKLVHVITGEAYGIRLRYHDIRQGLELQITRLAADWRVIHFVEGVDDVVLVRLLVRASFDERQYFGHVRILQLMADANGYIVFLVLVHVWDVQLVAGGSKVLDEPPLVDTRGYRVHDGRRPRDDLSLLGPGERIPCGAGPARRPLVAGGRWPTRRGLT